MTVPKSIREPLGNISVSGCFDVIVVGGGIGGVAATVAAARNGASTCLIERSFGLGGLATLGNVIEYLPLCDGMGHQVIKGLGEELLKLSIKDGFDVIPACWRRGGDVSERIKKRYRVSFNPMSFMLELEGLISRNGVKLYYDTRFCRVIKEGGLIKAVIVENKNGRSALLCKAVVDASGDADVCRQSGEKTVSWKTNVCAGWFYYFDGKTVRLNKFSRWYDACGKCLPASGRNFAGDDADEVTDFMLETRKLIRRELVKIKKKKHIVRPLFMPYLPALRMTRRLQGALELEQDHDRQYFEDAVGMTGDWRKKGPVFFIPFRALAAVKTGNLIAAGRCISAGKTSWDIMRAIPTCAVTGEAAGTASAMLRVNEKKSFAELDIVHLQERLRSQKVVIKE